MLYIVKMLDDIKLRQIKELWIDTFGDSNEYVNNLFDAYCDKMLTELDYDGDTLVSSLIAIPYEFNTGISEKECIRGLYLCGLATRKEYRGKGRMTYLLESIRKRAIEEGYDFLFLIPSDDVLREYYSYRYFIDSFYKKAYRFVAGYDFLKLQNTPSSDISSDDIDDDDISCIDYCSETSINKTIYRDRIIKFILNRESLNRKDINCKSTYHNSEKQYSDDENRYIHDSTVFRLDIMHDSKDAITLINERIISDDKIYILQRGDEIISVAFTKCVDDIVVVDKVYYSTLQDMIILLDDIAKIYCDKSTEVLVDSVDLLNTEQIWNPFYIASDSPDDKFDNVSTIECNVSNNSIVKPYGMIDIFNSESLLNKVLLNYGISEEEIARVMSSLNGIDNKTITKMLMRHPVSDDYAEFAFNIPVISPSIALLME